MKPDNRFSKQPRNFWAHVRTIGQVVGYTERGKGQIKVPTLDEVLHAYKTLGLETNWLAPNDRANQTLRNTIFTYFQYRADILNDRVEALLMDAKDAEALYSETRKRLKPKRPPPMNKQKGDKKQIAYLTALVNMIVEANIGGLGFDSDPRVLTTIVRDNLPIHTLARRVDGAFPSPINPIAIWEIKEYYYTTTFGSRVADGVYETLLDGMELELLRNESKINVLHYLMVDSHFTWWECGRPYLCRIVDMMHMGYVDEVFFGKEVVTALPAAVKGWVALAKH
jgi:hypothetical protein